jgi:hypothetical protein
MKAKQVQIKCYFWDGVRHHKDDNTMWSDILAALSETLIRKESMSNIRGDVMCYPRVCYDCTSIEISERTEDKRTELIAEEFYILRYNTV